MFGVAAIAVVIFIPILTVFATSVENWLVAEISLLVIFVILGVVGLIYVVFPVRDYSAWHKKLKTHNRYNLLDDASELLKEAYTLLGDDSKAFPSRQINELMSMVVYFVESPKLFASFKEKNSDLAWDMFRTTPIEFTVDVTSIRTVIRARHGKFEKGEMTKIISP